MTCRRHRSSLVRRAPAIDRQLVVVRKRLPQGDVLLVLAVAGAEITDRADTEADQIHGGAMW